MKAKNLMLGAVALSAVAGRVGAHQPVEAGLSLDKPVVMGEQVAVKHVTKKVYAEHRPESRIDLDEYAHSLSGEKLAVKKTTKKLAAS